MGYKHILSVSQFEAPFLARFFQEVKMMKDLSKSRNGKMLLRETLKGLSIGLIFWPPSSRTFHSFLSAAERLGGSVGSERGIRRELGGRVIWELPFSSETKGENFEDSICAFASSYDALVIRHFEEGAVARAANILDEFASEYDTHIINAGDGPGEHPTQALLDLWSILEHFGYDMERDKQKLQQLRIAFIGDNKAGRTVHSLAPLLGKLFGMEITFISPSEFSYPADKEAELRRTGVRYKFADTFVPADIYYVTRLNITDYFSKKDEKKRKELELLVPQYAVTKRVVEENGVQLVLHPFPRREELPIWLPSQPKTWDTSVDKMPQAGYRAQMRDGKFVRMALLKIVMVPYLDLSDMYRSRWGESFYRQCAFCGRTDSTIFGWSEKAVPRSYFLPKVLCPLCAPQQISAPQNQT